MAKVDPIENTITHIKGFMPPNAVVALDKAIGWPRGGYLHIFTEHRYLIASDGDVEFGEEVDSLRRITSVAEATWVVFFSRVGDYGSVGRREVKVAISDQADQAARTAAASAVARFFYGEEVDYGFIEAMQSLEKARRWVADHHEVEPGPDSFSVRLDGRRTQIHDGHEIGLSPLRRLREKWGPELFEPWFSEGNDRWAKAYQDPDLMIRFLVEEAVLGEVKPREEGPLPWIINVQGRVLQLKQYPDLRVFPDNDTEVEDMISHLEFDDQVRVLTLVVDALSGANESARY